jgi:flagellar basal body-associated protein FliL
MATEPPAEGEAKKPKGSMGKLIIWFVVVTASIGGGFSTPLLIASFNTADKSEGDSHEAAAVDPHEEVEFIDFDEVVAVLGKSRFSRYLRLVMSLQVAKSQRLEVEAKITAKTAVLRNRIIAHVAEITEEDLAGQHGQNQLRRQIHRFFNEILFDDGIERVQDVLFREFQVQ